ncbi:hypothetical protein [Leptolyngbya ohadii]|uniref:hypothetical protein n=1 Tax=Leptolyngbya ohadii TaxID=1962290 RepID=UPI003F71372C
MYEAGEEITVALLRENSVFGVLSLITGQRADRLCNCLMGEFDCALLEEVNPLSRIGSLGGMVLSGSSSGKPTKPPSGIARSDYFAAVSGSPSGHSGGRYYCGGE